MTRIHSARLTLIPLDAEELAMFANDPKKLEEKLSLRNTGVILDAELREALSYRRSKAAADEEHYMWHTNWVVIHTEENRIVGGVMLKGPPNERGEVVLGYYTFPPYQGKGYMTESIAAMKAWLFEHPNVALVIADTEKGNTASHRVLEKAGATRYRESEELIYWKFERTGGDYERTDR
ncbi:GNAT family N-acetyltransferase [Paenibacillus sp. TRM 82003]|nr:GNAT family N-acetyltransferase [Paenibacillus sp. TRM 82003]